MKLGIMQPYFFPYIGYWQLIKAVDKYVIFDDVNYIKRGWINRNRILMNGEAKFINLHIHKASQNKLINEIEVQDASLCKNKLFKTIQNCYGKAPYYKDVIPVINSIILQNENNLSRYLEFSIKEICNYLEIDTQIVNSSSINKDNSLRGQEKIIQICKILNAKEYINAIGGQILYSCRDFSTQGIKLRFLKAGEIEYKQCQNKFVPNLSIIDILMFNSLNEIKEMLDNYEFI